MDSQTKTRTIQAERIGTTGIREKLRRLCEGLPVDPLPGPRKPNPNLAHAPKRSPKLTLRQEKLAVQNALRYFSTSLHDRLVGEFLQELRDYGHIYMYRLVPDMEMRAYPIELYPAKNQHAAAVMLMIMNNLDPEVAQFPEELITYGANGQVFSNWAQFWLTMHYLSIMTEEQTLAMYSGHPMGLFPSNHNSPRVIITNGMVIPNYSSTEDYDRMFALGVTMYGQMTAGSYCYIGPQGIVHGTTLTIMNAGRQYLGLNSLAGKVFVTAGLGGMSGAQAKASTICGCIGVIAEVDKVALMKRYEQGWLEEWTDDLDDLIKKIKIAKTDKRGTSIGYLGNVVSLWEKLRDHFEETKELLSELGSDQTSCHNPYGGGYYPVQLTYEKAKQVLSEDPELFKSLVQESLRRQIAAINVLADAGMFFWDYGNAFLLEAKRAKADVLDKVDETKFRYPSYVQDFMGDTFSLGFGPFRWVCTSADPDDLDRTDKIAEMVIQEILNEGVPSQSQWMYEANLQWIREAGKHHLVVGSQARIFYADQTGRIRMAKAFNDAVRNGEIGSPVVISRDHHDVSGTDSPFRETSNIYDGSAFTADMAVQNCIGDAVRGATWVAIHNGGGVGWGEVINGGFGLVLDGSKDAEERSALMLGWDVSNGVARRAWSGNQNAYETIRAAMERNSKLVVTLPATHVSNDVIEKAFDDS